MNGKVFGISWGLIIFAIIIAFVVQKWGNNIPLLNKV